MATKLKAHGIAAPRGRTWETDELTDNGSTWTYWRLRGDRGPVHIASAHERGSQSHGSVYLPDCTDADIRAVRQLIAKLRGL
jgi:hypothetical protein